MNVMLLADNILSILLVLVCWWLAHQNSAGREPFGRTIASGYSMVALAVLSNMLFRNFDVLSFVLPVSLLFSKAVLVFTLAAVAVRLSIIHPPPN